MADAQASGACGSNIVWVQVPSPAFLYVRVKEALRIRCFFFFSHRRHGCQKAAHNLVVVKLRKAVAHFMTLGENYVP